MEFLLMLLASLVIAGLLAAAFSGRYRTSADWPALWMFVLVIALFGLAGGIWTSPYGPIWGGIPWFGIVMWSVLIALLLAVFVTPPPRREQVVDPTPPDERAVVAAAGTVFWILVVLLVVAVAVGILR